MFGRKSDKLEQYYQNTWEIFNNNQVSVNGTPIPFKPNDFANVRDFLRAVVAMTAFLKRDETKKKKTA